MKPMRARVCVCVCVCVRRQRVQCVHLFELLVLSRETVSQTYS